MHILVIGAAGMVGRKLTAALVKAGRLAGKEISAFTLADVVKPDEGLAGFSGKVTSTAADLSTVGTAETLMASRPDVIFHLAAISYLGVAKETVRRDLRALEDHGLVRRTHGGAYPVESAGFETTLAFRATSHVPEKRRVAAAAAELIGDAETVFVDEGFTPQLIAEALPTDRPLTVVTASRDRRRVEVRPGATGDGYVAVTPLGGTPLRAGDEVVTGIARDAAPENTAGTVGGGP